MDLILAGIIAVGAITGFIKGGLKQLAALVGLVVGLLLARAMFAALGAKLATELGTSVTIAQIIAFVMIWIIVPVILSLIATALTKMIEIVNLGLLNRLLGAALGGLKYVLILSLVISFLEYVDDKDELIGKKVKESSVLYHQIEDFSGMFIPAMKNVTNELLETV